MEPFPKLRTDRLTLREFVPQDAPEVQRLVGAREVARTLPVPTQLVDYILTWVAEIPEEESIHGALPGL